MEGNIIIINNKDAAQNSTVQHTSIYLSYIYILYVYLTYYIIHHIHHITLYIGIYTINEWDAFKCIGGIQLNRNGQRKGMSKCAIKRSEVSIAQYIASFPGKMHICASDSQTDERNCFGRGRRRRRRCVCVFLHCFCYFSSILFLI